MTEVPPLFLQTGQYSAAYDRYSIGALLSGSGDEINGVMRPLIGVRPIGLVSTASGNVERSLRVHVVGSTINIDPGAAFVPSGSLSGINGVYLVVVENPIYIPLPAATGATMQYSIHLVVYDPEDTAGGGDSGSTMWEVAIFDSANTPPASSLPLASISIPSAGASTVGDTRTYSTSMGGVYVSNSSADLLGRTMPVGTLGFIRDENTVWVREPASWVSLPVIASSDTTTFATRQGELRWNNLSGILQVTYLTGSPATPVWGEVGHLPHQARSGYATSWPLQSSTQSLTPVAFWAQMATANVYYMINDAAMVNIEGKPTQPADRRDAEVQVKINSVSGVVGVTLCAACTVRKNETDFPVATFKAYIAIAVLNYIPPEEGEGEDGGEGTEPPPSTSLYTLDVNYNGIIFLGSADNHKCRTIYFNLMQGEYLLRPMFLITQPGVIEVSNLTLQASVHG